MLAKIDQWLISRPYQGIVDVTQKKPVWWIEQCGFVLFVSTILKYFIDTDPITWATYLSTFLGLMTAGFAFWFSRMPVFLQMIAKEHRFRVFMLGMCLVSFGFDFTKPWDMAIVTTLYDLASMSVYYFAACQNPRPREPRTRHATAT